MNNKVDTKLNELIGIVPETLKKTVVNYQICRRNLVFSNYVVLITIFLKFLLGAESSTEWVIQIVSIVVGLLIIFMMICKKLYQYRLKEYLKSMNMKHFEIFDVMISLIAILLLVDTIVSILTN